MTSKGSLAKKSKFTPLLHEILWTARRYWWVSVVGMLLFFALSFVGKRLEGNDPAVFSIIMWDSEVAMRIAGVVYGIFVAFCMFRFLWSRRECGLYLSVGAARWKQFMIRYLFGSVSVILGIVIPFLITYYTEMQEIGKDTFGVCAHYTAIYVFSMVILTLLSYTVGVLVSVLCGHFLSALLTTAGVLAAPYTLLWGVQQMLGFYLFGTPLSTNLLSNHFGAGLFTMLADQLPHMSFNRLLLERYETIAATDGVTMAELLKAEISLPTLRIVFLIILMVVLAVLAGFAFCRRPAEHAGKAVVHPVLSHVVALANGLCIAALVLNAKAPVVGVGGMVILTVLFLLAFVLASALVRLALIRDFKGTIRHYPIPCGAAAVCLLFTILLGTGWFGYASYMPDAEDVESVTLTYNQNLTLMNDKPHSAYASGTYAQVTEGSYQINFLYTHGFTIPEESLPMLTAPEDVEIALAIHEAIIADGRQTFTGNEADEHARTVVPVFYHITYQLKNGKTVDRYYECLTLATLEKTVDVENTAAYRNEIATLHSDMGFVEAEAFEFGDPLFAAFTSVTLSEEDRKALAAALDADTTALTAEERYFGTDDPKRDQVIGIIRARSTGGSSRMLGTHPHDGKYETFYITAAWENTLAFMEEKGFAAYFENDYTVTAVHTQVYTPRFFHKSLGKAVTYVFFSCDNTIQLTLPEDYKPGIDLWENIQQVTTAVPEAEWDAYIENSRSVALMTRPGRMVQIKLTNAAGEEKLVTRYLYDE